jgi:hypothetical protein
MVSRPPGGRWSPALPVLAVLVVIGTLLRLWRLSHWGFEGDEIFTYRDSIVPPDPGNPRPLLYFLNYFVVRPWLALDERGLRLVPVLAGIATIPVMYLLVRRLVSERAGMVSALLLTFNALHVYHSQNARYWTLVFLLSSVYPLALYLGIRARSRGWLITGIVTAPLAIAAHPVSGLLLVGLGLWAVPTYLRRDTLPQLWTQRSLRWGIVALALLALVAGVRYAPVLHSWMRMPHHPRLRGVALALSYVDGLTLGLVVLGAMGVYWLWRVGDRALALLLTCLVIGPFALLVPLSYLTAVSTAYLLPTAPVFFVGAGIFIDRLLHADLGLRPRWLAPAGIGLIVLAGNAPMLMSQYRDGSRADFRGAARWVAEHYRPGDLVVADQSRAFAHYFPQASVTPMPDLADPLEAALDRVSGGGTLWAVALSSQRGGFRGQKLGSLDDWMYGHCQLRASLGVPRLDFRQNQIQIYRCPPAAP